MTCRKRVEIDRLPAATGRRGGVHRGQLAAAVLGCILGGCASPPSVVPLLTVVDGALAQERALLAEDGERQASVSRERLAALTRGFEADLAGRESLDHDWVAEHVAVYVAARDVLAADALGQQAALTARQRNLEAALAAQRRAIALITRQDALLAEAPDLRRWLADQPRQHQLETQR